MYVIVEWIFAAVVVLHIIEILNSRFADEFIFFFLHVVENEFKN